MFDGRMMEYNSGTGRLVGPEIHGFHTLEDLDVGSILEEANTRWLRPNEIHAILYNHNYFPINVKPVNLPKSGTILLFDRKMFRNFRKDGYNWKKKKDGKTVKEAHEHLKVGNDERIHVYYAHGEDNPSFVRRCYWLLDKKQEHIVFVHYRETQESRGSPATPVNSNSNSGLSEGSSPYALSEGADSAMEQRYYGATTSALEPKDSMTVKNYEQRLHEINTLEWDELLGPDDPQRLSSPQEGNSANQYQMDNQMITILGEGLPVGSQSVISRLMPSGEASDVDKAGLLAQDSFGKWMSDVIADSPESLVDEALEPSSLNANESFNYPVMDNRDASPRGQIFNICDVSPGWAFSTEETKIFVVGSYKEGYQPLTGTKLYLVCGNCIVPLEEVQTGVYRCLLSPQAPGLVNLYMTIDGNNPISEVLTFELRAPVLSGGPSSLVNEADWKEFQLQMRLAHLLFSSSRYLSIYSGKISQAALKEARAFSKKTLDISESWLDLGQMIEDAKLPFPQVKDRLLELTLQNRLHEWLLEKVVSGNKVSERDEQGLGVIHLCAILGYTWAVYPFSWSGLSLDYRDKFGWTALHWAAYHGKEKMVATLLSAGAKANPVTDPTSQNPDGCTAADLASKNGYEGLAAYLAEKALVAQFDEMTLAGNVSGSLQITANDTITTGNFTDEELYLKDALAAYRTAADAAARIQAAFREHSFKVMKTAVESSNPEMEARNIIAALKIQHAFRNYESRKRIAAAARIQYRFRTWKIRKDYLNMRRQAIRIQAIFRGFQTRKQHRKIIWSVGVLEKAILRWRLKRKGFRGLQVQSDETVEDGNQGSDVEEDFFKASRKQAEDRVERSVVKVQAMFRSKRAQEEYTRMKLEHNKAKLEYQELQHSDAKMR